MFLEAESHRHMGVRNLLPCLNMVVCVDIEDRATLVHKDGLDGCPGNVIS